MVCVAILDEDVEEDADMRLIDADALMDAMREEEFQNFVPLDEVDSVIDNAPTIEAKPVRHGKWVRDDLGNTRCSKCEKRLPFFHCYNYEPNSDYDEEWDEEIQEALYCPHCGAKLDLEEK